MTKFN